MEEHLEKDTANIAENSTWYLTKKEIFNEHKLSYDLKKHMPKKTLMDHLKSPNKLGDMIEAGQMGGRVVKNFFHGWRLRVDDDLGTDKINDDF